MRRTLMMVALATTGCSGLTKDPEVPLEVPPEETPTEEPPDAVAPGTDSADPELRVRLHAHPDAIPQGDPDEVLAGRLLSAVFEASELSATLRSDIDGPLGAVSLLTDGRFEFPAGGLSAGLHQITLEGEDPDGQTGVAEQEVPVCAWPALEDFSSNVLGSGWSVFGDAFWDDRGWLEMTGARTDRSGAIFYTARKLNPGDFRIDFRIATGGGANGGADGFALSVFDAADEVELASIVNHAASGGCLGYGVSPPCGTMEVSGFHIEFDTWQNNGSPIVDPTSESHVAITLDGDPGDHLLWAARPYLENLQWRQVSVTGQGTHLEVTMNGVVVLSGDIPNFRFDGGYIGVSGSTGSSTNFHRFDDLQLYDRCLVPE